MKLHKKLLSLYEHYAVQRLMHQARNAPRGADLRPGLLIMGWYGKETTGDKAILASLLSHLDPRAVRILKLTYDVEFSRQTLAEIGNFEVKCVPYTLRDAVRALAEVDVVVIGGGPLLECGHMREWQQFLSRAKDLGKKVMIYGCGIGPLHTPRGTAEISGILELADTITLRDSKSVAHALRFGIPPERLTLTADPALGLRIPTPESHSLDRSCPRLGVSLRRVSKHYFANAGVLERGELERTLHVAIEQALRHMLEDHGTQLILFPMQTHPGDDDRPLLRNILGRLGPSDSVSVIENDWSLYPLLAQFKTFDFLVGMRYHSVVFGLLNNIPLVAIDYDAGVGKVTALMQAMQLSDYVINIRDVTPTRLTELLERGFNERNTIRVTIERHFPQLQLLELHNSLQLNDLLKTSFARAA